jgi:hypothetical protein
MFSVYESGNYIGSGSNCKTLTTIIVRDYIGCHSTCSSNICLHYAEYDWKEFIRYVSGVFAIDTIAGGGLHGTKLCGVTIREIAEIFKGHGAKNGK